MPGVTTFVLITAVALAVGTILRRIWRMELPHIPLPPHDPILDVFPNKDPKNDETEIGWGGKDADITWSPTSVYLFQVVESYAEQGPSVGTTFKLYEGRNKLGRSPRRENKVEPIKVVGDKAISGDHAYIYLDLQTGKFTWENCNSFTRINDQPLLERAKTQLNEGDLIKVGDTTFKFVRRAALSSGQEVDMPTHPARGKARPKRFQFRVTKGDFLVPTFQLDTYAVIGRGQRADWRFPETDTRMSRAHVEVRREGNQVKLKDLNSDWRVFVNGREVNQRTLEHNDSIQLGDTIILFEVLDH